ncbi:hypothetical protein [Streptomyces sp. NPDC008139]
MLKLSVPVASVRAFAAGEASTAPAEGSDDGESTALEPSALS